MTLIKHLSMLDRSLFKERCTYVIWQTTISIKVIKQVDLAKPFQLYLSKRQRIFSKCSSQRARTTFVSEV